MSKLKIKSDGTYVVGDDDKIRIEVPGGGDVVLVADPDDEVEEIRIEFRGDDHSDKVTVDLSTFSEDDLEIEIKHYDPSDILNLVGAFDAHVDPDDEDEYIFSYYGSDGKLYSGTIKAKDGGEKDFTDPDPPITLNFVCFGRGTLIAVPGGRVPVEDLAIGDLVLTRDHGPQRLRWIGRRQLGTLELIRAPHLRPITVRAGAFGKGAPDRDLSLSPQHRVVIADWRAQLLFGEDELMVPIKALVNDRDIQVERNATEVEYFHLLFDRHEIVFANDLPSESLLLGKEATKGIGAEAMAEVAELFGDPMSGEIAGFSAACPIVRMRDGVVLGNW